MSGDYDWVDKYFSSPLTPEEESWGIINDFCSKIMNHTDSADMRELGKLSPKTPVSTLTKLADKYGVKLTISLIERKA